MLIVADPGPDPDDVKVIILAAKEHIDRQVDIKGARPGVINSCTAYASLHLPALDKLCFLVCSINRLYSSRNRPFRKLDLPGYCFQAMPHNALHGDVYRQRIMRHCLEHSPTK